MKIDKDKSWNDITQNILNLSQNAMTKNMVSIGDEVRYIHFFFNEKQKDQCIDQKVDLDSYAGGFWSFGKHQFSDNEIDEQFIIKTPESIKFIIRH